MDNVHHHNHHDHTYTILYHLYLALSLALLIALMITWSHAAIDSGCFPVTVEAFRPAMGPNSWQTPAWFHHTTDQTPWIDASKAAEQNVPNSVWRIWGGALESPESDQIELDNIFIEISFLPKLL